MIFCWIKPCSFLAESNSPKYLLLHLATESVLVFVLFCFVSSWITNQHCIVGFKSFTLWITISPIFINKHLNTHVTKHTETGQPVGDLRKLMTQTAECPEVRFKEWRLGTTPGAPVPISLVIDLYLLSPKCLRPILVGSWLKTCFRGFSPKWGRLWAPVNDGGVRLPCL